MATLRQIISDPTQLDALLVAVDNDMRAEGVVIPWRPVEGLRRVSEKLHCSIVMNSPEAQAINAWFIRRYGERLKIDYGKYSGETIAVIKGDPYLVKFPLIFGTVRVNPLTWVQEVAPSLWSTMSNTEIDELCRSILRTYDEFQWIMRCLPRNATPDIGIAVHHILALPPQPGLALWASLQAVEKSLKAYITGKGGKPPKGGKHGHDLVYLAQQAEGLGLPPLDRVKIGRVQCSAGVRYDVKVTLDHAIDAHQMAVDMCAHIARKCPPKT